MKTRLEDAAPGNAGPLALRLVALSEGACVCVAGTPLRLFSFLFLPWFE